MKPKSLLQSSLLPLSSVQLGRLVLNAKNPQQDFLDPCPPNSIIAESTVKTQENFEEIISLSKSSRIRSHLTVLLAVSRENRYGGAINLTASRATTYQLLNSGTWFRSACAAPETREWFEKAVEIAGTVYLVVGFHTLTDARVTEGVATQETGGESVRVSGATLSGGSFPTSNLLDSRIGSSKEINFRHARSFGAPGEQIYAIQYRKVVFKWFSSRAVENASLERDNRWKICWSGADATRGREGYEYGTGSGVPTPEEEEDENEEEEEEDMLEVDLTDEVDFDFTEKYVTEDGREEYVF